MKTINIEDESPYCDVCGTCGYIGCCGIRNFISEHIEGKTNCKNEDLIISELIDLCDYKDYVFKQNDELKKQVEEKDKEIERLNNIIDDALGIANERVNFYHHNKNKEQLEDLEKIFDILVVRDNSKELKEGK